MFVINLSVLPLFLFQIQGVQLQETNSQCYKNSILPMTLYKEDMTRKLKSASNWTHLLDIIYHELYEFQSCGDKKLRQLMKTSCMGNCDSYNQMTKDLYSICNYILDVRCNYKHYHHCIYYLPLIEEETARSIYIEYTSKDTLGIELSN